MSGRPKGISFKISDDARQIITLSFQQSEMISFDTQDVAFQSLVHVLDYYTQSSYTYNIIINAIKLRPKIIEARILTYNSED